MPYKWLVVWWIITVTNTSTQQGDGLVISSGTTSAPWGAVSKHISIDETHRKVDVNFALFKTKDEAEKYMTGSYGYSGNTKHKYQLIELSPQIEWQRPDASAEQKELMKDQ